jgi:hypothetical protein
MPMERRTATGSIVGSVEALPVDHHLALDRAPGMTSCMRFSDRRKVDLPQPEGR